MSEPGVSPIRREARPYQGRPAGVVSRGAAAAIDAVVVTVIDLAAYVGFALVLFLLRPRDFSWPSPSILGGLAFWLGILVAYLTLGWWVSGRTYGSLVMGLRVESDSRSRAGGRLGFTRAASRALLYALLPIGLGWCAVSAERRSLQDVVLHTRVVYDWQPRGSARRR